MITEEEYESALATIKAYKEQNKFDLWLLKAGDDLRYNGGSNGLFTSGKNYRVKKVVFASPERVTAILRNDKGISRRIVVHQFWYKVVRFTIVS